MTRHLLSSLRVILAAAALALGATAQAADPVGHTPGEFSVDPTGAANYRIPIAVPPGIAGMQPDLALLYSSRAGNGQLGVGWSISGLSAITRCPKTKAQDGATYMDGVDFDIEDRLCLDGQHLLYADTTPTDAEYWAATSYSTEIASFQQITGSVPNGALGHSYFTVKDKAGLTRYYGNTTETKIEVKGAATAPIMVWALQRIEDKFGNEISFLYVETAEGEYYPTEIAWKNDAGFQAGKVVFEYSNARPDKTSGYLPGGGLVALAQRLSTLKVYARNTLVRRYNLSYIQHNTSSQSHLSQIQECNGAGECLRPTTFLWDQGVAGFRTTPLNFSGHLDDLKLGDFDGDGRTDRLYRDDGHGHIHIRFGGQVSAFGETNINAVWLVGGYEMSTAVVIDYDGDGDQDLLAVKGNGSNGLESSWTLIRSNGAARTMTVVGSVGPHLGSYDDHPRPLPLDIDGDGLPELIYHDQGTLWFYKNSPTGFLSTPVDTTYAVDGDTRITPMEWNGDGRPDLLVHYKNGASCNPSCPAGLGVLVNTGAGFVRDVNGPVLAGLAMPHAAVHVLDVNGDGLSDVLYAKPYNGPNSIDQWFLRKNDGVGTMTAEEMLILQPSHVGSSMVLDYNKDGRDDLMFAKNGTWQVSQSTGTTLYATPVDTGLTDGGSYRDSATLVDIDGDGHQDLFRVANSDAGEWKIYWGNGVFNGLMRGYASGTGAGGTISFWSLSEPLSPYYVEDPAGQLYERTVSGELVTPVSLPSPEYREYLGPMYVVKEIWVSDGTPNNSIRTEYHYAGAKMNVWGRGFAGFRRIYAINYNGGTYTANYHRQDFPYTGMVEVAVQKTTGTRELLNPEPPDGGASLQCENAFGEPVHADGCEKPYAAMYNTVPGKLVSTTVNTLDAVDLANLDYAKVQPDYQYPSIYAKVGRYPFVKTTDVVTYDINKDPLDPAAVYKREFATYTNDVCGNATRIVAQTSKNLSGVEQHTVDTANTYSDQADNVCFGRLTQVAVTNTRPSYGNTNAAPLTATRTSQFTYFPGHRHLESETILSSEGLTLTKTYAYDGFGNRVSEGIIGGGVPTRTTTTGYDANGQYVIRVTNALGQSETRNWDYRFGVQVAVTGPNGLTTQWQYDNFGRKVGETAPRTTVFTNWSYDWCDAATPCLDTARAKYRVKATGADGSESITEYDMLDRPVLTSKSGLSDVPNGLAEPAYKTVITETHYDSLGRAYATSLPYFAGASVKCWDFKEHDDLNRVVAQRLPASEQECANLLNSTTVPAPTLPPAVYTRVATTAYDGLKTRATDPTGRIVERETNPVGRLRFAREMNGAAVRVIDGKNVETEYDYDAFGNTTWVQDANDKVTHLGYNDRGFKASMTDPDMGAWTYGYNALGELTGQTDAKGQSATLSYDNLGRLIQRVEPEGTTKWHYDTGYGKGVGKPALVLAPDGYMEAYAYDEFGAVTDTMRVIDDQLHWVSQTYDNRGRPDVMVYPDIQVFNATTAPGAPSFVSPPTTSTGTHTLNWTETSDYAVYRLYRGLTTNSADAAEIHTSPVASYQDSVAAEATYRYWVKACHAELCSALTGPAAVVVTLPPGAPAHLSVPDYDTNNDGSYTITWGDSDKPSVTYELYESTLSTFGSQTQVYTGTAKTTTLNGRLDGTYYYRVRACLSGVCGPYRLADTATKVTRTPGAPGSITAPAYDADGTFNVSWGASTTGTVTQYELYKGYWSFSACNFSNETLLYAGTAITRSVTASNGNHCFRVRACQVTPQITLCSAYATTPGKTGVGPTPAAPTGLVVQSTSVNGSIALNWNPVVDLPWFEVEESTAANFSANVVNYQSSGYECITPSPVPEDPCLETGPTSDLTVTGKGNGTYYYRVRACETWTCSAWATGANPAVVTLPPGVPASITVPATSTGSYAISWGASTGTVTAYELYESTSSSFTTQTQVYSGTEISKALTKVTSGTFYYRVRACNSGQCSGYRTGGNSIVVTVSTVPSVPTLSTSTTFSTDGTYTISWTQSTGTVTAYELERAIPGDTYSLNYSGTALSRHFSHGFGELEFNYRVRACNGTNCSAYSNVVSVSVMYCGGMGCAYVLPPRPKLDEPEPDRLAAVGPDAEKALPVGASTGSRSELVKVSGAEVEGFHLMPPPRPADLARAVEEVPAGASSSSRSSSPGYHVGLAPIPVAITPPAPVKPLRQHPLLIAKYLERGGRLPFKATKVAINGPSGTYAHMVQQVYGSKGHLLATRQCILNAGYCDPNQGTVYWRAEAADPAGRVIQERLGNNTATTRVYDEAAGTLRYLDTEYATNHTPIQDLDFTWDKAGNLLTRAEDLSNTITDATTKTEVFTYDPLHRLATGQLTDGGVQQAQKSYTFDPVGNVKTSAEATGYVYGSPKPHAVTQYTKGGVNYGFTYDANGNVLTKTQGGATLRQVCWQSSNHPTVIAAGTVTNCATGAVSSGVEWNRFSYAPDRSRYRRLTGTGGTTSSTTVYVGSLFEKTSWSTTTDYLHYIRGGGRVVATFTRRVVSGGSTTDTTEYWHRDHLESVAVRTNQSGAVVANSRVQYDAWGKPVSGTLATRNRGYTGHEHLASLGLIHMNGRVYDPEIGRFLSPDTFVQFPEGTQGFNRYSYVSNNPLSYNDPSGHLSVALAALLGYQSAKNYEAGGVKAMVQGWVLAGISAGMSYAIGTAFQTAVAQGAMSATNAFFTKALVHGVSQGALSKAGGGRFGDGFLGGLAGGLTEGIGLPKGPMGVIGAAIIGGTVSKIGGGNFANGAISAAFVQAFGRTSEGTTDEGTLEGASLEDLSGMTRAEIDDFVFSSPQVADLQLPALPQGMVDAAAGFGDAMSFGGTRWYRDWRGINGGVNYDSLSYDGAYVAGALTPGLGTAAVARGAAWAGSTATGAGRWLNTGRYWRVGPGRMPANGSLPAGTHVPRISIGPGPKNPHIDLRIRPFD